MKHCIATRLNFGESKLDLLNSYLEVSKSMLIPSLMNQTVSEFDWVIILNKKHEALITNYIQYKFIPMYSMQEYESLVKEAGYSIQTRHDIDDWMSTNYVEAIQKICKENSDQNEFLIHCQPTKIDYLTGLEYRTKPYSDKFTSMFLTLYQRVPTRSVYCDQHTIMNRIIRKVKTLPEGYAKLVIHGNNILSKIKETDERIS